MSVQGTITDGSLLLALPLAAAAGLVKSRAPENQARNGPG